jgi:hypothetical protein
MRINAALVGVALLLNPGSAAKSFGQIPVSGYTPGLVTGAPFSATWRETARNHGKVISQMTIQVARAANGSIYSAMVSVEGTPQQIEICDVPNNRLITVNAITHTYKLSTPDGGKFRTLSVQQFTELLQKLQDANAQGVEHPPVRYVSLGVKQDSGMTLYGQKVVWIFADEDIQESWMSSDLGTKAGWKEIRPSSELDVVGALTEIRREEPDPKLFRVPEGYAQTQIVSPHTEVRQK